MTKKMSHRRKPCRVRLYLVFPVLGLAGACSLPESHVVEADNEVPEVQVSVKNLLEVDGEKFRDLNGDGKLNDYEDWRLSPERRAIDLVERMTPEEKVGAMMHSTLPGEGPGAPWSGTSYDLDIYSDILEARHVTHFITRLSFDPATLASQHNQIQELAEATRLGIPVTISTDPRNHFEHVLGASAETVGFTQWPEPLGFAALRDVERVRQFGDIVRQEYRAVGIHMALSPQADLATEPRWPRQLATFGSRPELTSRLAGAYVQGFQGSPNGITSQGVMTVAKHWVGYGAAPEGFDGHNYYGRHVDLNEKQLQTHIDAFRGVLAADTAGIMPTYSILREATWRGRELEAVGAGYSKGLLTDLLRGELGYEGVLLSDWAITNDCPQRCMEPTADAPQTPDAIATPWGVEDLTVYQRFVKGVNAGLDQFGGTHEVKHLIDAVRSGDLPEERLNQSVHRIMKAKFQLGLFDNPYVDSSLADKTVGAEHFVALAERTQRESQVLLKNRNDFLPIGPEMKRVYLHGMNPFAAEAKGLIVVDDLAKADFAILRAQTPSETLHPHHFFGGRQNEGRLDFRAGDSDYDALMRISGEIPTVLSVFLNRPAILTKVQDMPEAVVANFGASDEAVIDVVVGNYAALGRLPFELPASMESANSQNPSIPDDSKNPLYPFGYGL